MAIVPFLLQVVALMVARLVLVAPCVVICCWGCCCRCVELWGLFWVARRSLGRTANQLALSSVSYLFLFLVFVES